MTARTIGRTIQRTIAKSLGDDGASGVSVDPPTITVQPVNTTANETQTATFTVTATGDGVLSYQWQKQESGAGDWSNVGTDSNSYTTAALTRSADNTDQYRVNVLNAGGTTTSNAVTLTVFNPTVVSGLHSWLDANDSSSVLNSISPDVSATDGQTVRRVNDRSGGGFHWNQATGVNQPLYQTGEVNGRPVLEFDETNDSLVSQLFATGNTITVFLVYQSSDTSMVPISDLANAGRLLLVATQSSTDTVISSNSGTVTLEINNAPATINNRGAVYTALNGTKIAKIDANNISAWDRSAGNFRQSGYGGSLNWSHKLCEKIVFNGTVSDSDDTLICTYLSQKWGISL